MIAAVLDDSPSRHAQAVAALVRAAGPASSQSSAEGITLLAWGEPTFARFDSDSHMAWVGEPFAGDDARLALSKLPSLSGDFALVARDAGAVRAARGYFGGRALYFSVPRPHRSTVVCSRLGPLVAVLGKEATLDRERLTLMMAGVDGPGGTTDRSPFEEIRRLRSGEILELRAQARSAAGHLELPRPIVLPDMTPAAIASELRSRLRKVVARHLAGLERVAILASGGVDSSAIVAASVEYARANGRPAIDVVTVDASGPGDDRPYFDLLCRHLGVTPIRFTAAQCAPYMRRAWTLDATPCVWPNGAWEWPLLEAARARGAEIVLTGVGGDDVYEGDPRLLGEEARGGRVLEALASALRLRTYYQPSAWGRVRDFVLRPLVTPWIPARVRHARLRALASRVLPWATAYARDVIVGARSSLRPPPAASGQELVARLAVSQQLIDPIDARMRLEAQTGCMVRDPLFAPELVEIVASVPARVLLHGDRLRGLFRRALEGLVPDPVRLRSDKASFEPALTEMLGAAGGLHALRDLSTAEALGRMGLIDSREFERAFRAAESRDNGLSWASWGKLFPVLAIEAFVRAHEEGRWALS